MGKRLRYKVFPMVCPAMPAWPAGQIFFLKGPGRHGIRAAGRRTGFPQKKNLAGRPGRQGGAAPIYIYMYIYVYICIYTHYILYDTLYISDRLCARRKHILKSETNSVKNGLVGCAKGRLAAAPKHGFRDSSAHSG